jgi:hypothetical protein
VKTRRHARIDGDGRSAAERVCEFLVNPWCIFPPKRQGRKYEEEGVRQRCFEGEAPLFPSVLLTEADHATQEPLCGVKAAGKELFILRR